MNKEIIPFGNIEFKNLNVTAVKIRIGFLQGVDVDNVFISDMDFPGEKKL